MSYRDTEYPTLIDHCVERSKHPGDYWAKCVTFLYDLREGRKERFALSDRQSAWLTRIEADYRRRQ